MLKHMMEARALGRSGHDREDAVRQREGVGRGTGIEVRPCKFAAYFEVLRSIILPMQNLVLI